MKLIASMLSHNEMKRFLPLAVSHLLTYCDEIRVIDDGSTDGSYEWLSEQDQVKVKRNSGPGFYHDESMIRNQLLEWTFEGRPTHVLSVDADEFVADGQGLRAMLGEGFVWGLTMREIWKADNDSLWTREDGGWRGHVAPIVYAVPRHRNTSWRIQQKKLACGRIPMAVQRHVRQVRNTEIDILHFGWTPTADRTKRYARYAEHDRGQFHARAHLNSILWTDKRVALAPLAWPKDLPKNELLERVK